MRKQDSFDSVKDLELMSSANEYNHWIFKHFEPYIGMHTLEVGCGSGNITNEYVRKIKTGTVLEPDKNKYDIIKSLIKKPMEY